MPCRVAASNCTSGPASDCAARNSAVLKERARRLPEMPRILAMVAPRWSWTRWILTRWIQSAGKAGIDAHFAHQHVVDRAGIGDLQQARALFFAQLAPQRDAAGDVGAALRLAGRIELQFGLDARQWPLLAGRVHLQRDHGAGAQAGQQQAGRIGPLVGAAPVRRLVAQPGVRQVVAERDGEGNRAAAGVDGGCSHEVPLHVQAPRSLVMTAPSRMALVTGVLATISSSRFHCSLLSGWSECRVRCTCGLPSSSKLKASSARNSPRFQPLRSAYMRNVIAVQADNEAR